MRQTSGLSEEEKLVKMLGMSAHDSAVTVAAAALAANSASPEAVNPSASSEEDRLAKRVAESQRGHASVAASPAVPAASDESTSAEEKLARKLGVNTTSPASASPSPAPVVAQAHASEEERLEKRIADSQRGHVFVAPLAVRTHSPFELLCLLKRF